MKALFLRQVVSTTVLLTALCFSANVLAECKDNSEHYIIFGDTVYDKKANLTWARCSVGQAWKGSGCVGVVKTFVFGAAQELASAGWRLPTVDELKTLLTRGCPGSMINTDAFPDMGELVYWPSTSLGSAAWHVSFSDGTARMGGRGYSFAVRLVRDAGTDTQ